LGGNEPLPQVGQRGIGLRGDLAPQELQMVFEVALPAARMRLRRATAAAAPPLPQFLDERATDTKAFRNCAWRCGPGFQGLNDTIPKVLRVGFILSTIPQMNRTDNCNPL
jgi:hypothetical protein